MSTRARAHVVAVLLASTGALVMPQLGWASSGGASLSGGVSMAGRGSPPRAGGATGIVQPGDVTVSASGEGISIAAPASALLRNRLRFTGSVSSAASGHIVEIERLGRETGWTWVPTAHGTAQADGSFTAVWPTNHIGRFAIRAVVEGRRRARAAAASPSLTVTVYRISIATQYGPGFYGQQTACGETLKPRTLGVANRSLACGTPVAIYYQGRTIVVPVIDRGPYANNADWDLTEATGRALGINGTATIGAVSLPSK